jgi:hypothetical protein
MPIISIKTYLKSIYPFEDITDQFNSSDWFFFLEKWTRISVWYVVFFFKKNNPCLILALSKRKKSINRWVGMRKWWRLLIRWVGQKRSKSWWRNTWMVPNVSETQGAVLFQILSEISAYLLPIPFKMVFCFNSIWFLNPYNHTMWNGFF